MAEGGDGTAAALMSAIRERRSVGSVSREPVDRETVEQLIEAAVWAPNHHLTCPWRFIVLAGDARAEVGAAHARAVARQRPDADAGALAKEAAKIERAPVVIACVVVASDDPVQAREDRDSVAAAVQNLLLLAHARGLGAIWRTGAFVDEREVREALGLSSGDEVVAFVYLGHPAGPSPLVQDRAGAKEVTSWRGW
jgi:nitroreductase